MLFDSGSAYIVVDDTVASAVAAALALKAKRSDYENGLKKTSRQFNLTKRFTALDVGVGPYPSKVSTIVSHFYQIPCSSGTIYLTIGSLKFTLTNSQYVFTDKDTHLCYSAIVGTDFSTVSNYVESKFDFAIIGVPFFRSSNLKMFSVDHANNIVRIDYQS
jgi:hypothetical protein